MKYENNQAFIDLSEGLKIKDEEKIKSSVSSINKLLKSDVDFSTLGDYYFIARTIYEMRMRRKFTKDYMNEVWMNYAFLFILKSYFTTNIRSEQITCLMMMLNLLTKRGDCAYVILRCCLPDNEYVNFIDEDGQSESGRKRLIEVGCCLSAITIKKCILHKEECLDKDIRERYDVSLKLSDDLIASEEHDLSYYILHGEGLLERLYKNLEDIIDVNRESIITKKFRSNIVILHAKKVVYQRPRRENIISETNAKVVISYIPDNQNVTFSVIGIDETILKDYFEIPVNEFMYYFGENKFVKKYEGLYAPLHLTIPDSCEIFLYRGKIQKLVFDVLSKDSEFYSITVIGETEFLENDQK